MPVKTIIMCGFICLLMHAPAQAEGIESDAMDIELFEFLADWETDDGQWVEPSAFERSNEDSNPRLNKPGSDTGDFRMTTTQEGHYDH